MNTLPTVEQLVGSKPPILDLDEQCVVKNFLGKSQAEARVLFGEQGFHLTEDFTYMAVDGLRYYLPPALDYMQSEQSSGDSDFCRGLLCSLYCQVDMGDSLPPDLLTQIKEVARFADAHRNKFEITPTESCLICI